MTTVTKRIQSGNIKLAVTTQGNAANPPVLLVHGYPDDSQTWQQVAKQLARQHFVITYDVRGCGQSDVPRSRQHYGLRYLLSDIVNVIKATSPHRPVHLVGHDWGSIQSWEAATEPGIERYIASFTTISGPCLDHVGMGLRDAFKDSLGDSLNQAIHSWYIGFFHLPLLPTGLWKLGLDRLWPQVVARTEGLKATASPSQQKDGVNGINLYRANMLPCLLRPRKRFAQVPVQVIIAEQDRYVTAPLLRDLPRWVADLTTHRLNTSHWGPLLQMPEQTAAHISDFIAHHSTSRQPPDALLSQA